MSQIQYLIGFHFPLTHFQTIPISRYPQQLFFITKNVVSSVFQTSWRQYLPKGIFQTLLISQWHKHYRIVSLSKLQLRIAEDLGKQLPVSLIFTFTMMDLQGYHYFEFYFEVFLIFCRYGMVAFPVWLQLSVEIIS